MAFKQFAAAVDADGLVRRAFVPGLAGEPVQDAHHLVEIGKHMGFGPSQRRQPQPCQLVLQRAAILLPQCQVMDEVARAGTVIGRHPGQRHGKALLGR